MKENVFKKQESRRLLTAALANAPRLSNQSAPIIFCCTIKAFLLEAGIRVSSQDIASIVLSRSILPDLQLEHSCEMLDIVQEKMEGEKMINSTEKTRESTT